MAFDGALLYVLIIGCEVAFWMVLLGGLVARYIIRRLTLSRWLLFSVPFIDVVLFVATVLDLRSGTPATFAHGLAAAYVGFTVAFGPVWVRQMDQWFAHRFAKGPVPDRPPVRGWSTVLYELRLWGRCVAACVMTVVLLFVMVAFIEDSTNMEDLRLWFTNPCRNGYGLVRFWPAMEFDFF